jgi:hypothetical protein
MKKDDDLLAYFMNGRHNDRYMKAPHRPIRQWIHRDPFPVLQGHALPEGIEMALLAGYGSPFDHHLGIAALGNRGNAETS